MTAVPSGSSPVWAIPGDDVGDEEVDVLSLAGQPVPDGGAWLWVTAAEKAAMKKVLAACPGQKLPAGGNPTKAPSRFKAH